MPSKTLGVEVRGLDVLKARLSTGRIFGPVKEELIKRAAVEGQKEAARASKPHAADKGTLGKRLRLTFEQDGLVARVAPDRAIMGIAFTIEEGRRPGRRPPRAAILRWMVSHGIVPHGKKPYREKVDEIRKDIMTSGTKGIKFMEQGQQRANDVLRDRISPVEREIEREFNG